MYYLPVTWFKPGPGFSQALLKSISGNATVLPDLDTTHTVTVLGRNTGRLVYTYG